MARGRATACVGEKYFCSIQTVTHRFDTSSFVIASDHWSVGSRDGLVVRRARSLLGDPVVLGSVQRAGFALNAERVKKGLEGSPVELSSIIDADYAAPKVLRE